MTDYYKIKLGGKSQLQTVHMSIICVNQKTVWKFHWGLTKPSLFFGATLYVLGKKH